MKFFKRNFEILFALLLAVVIFLLKYPVLNLPYSWDVMNYVIPSAQHIYEDGFTIFLWNFSNGHPPFYFILLGFVFKLFGSSPLVSHLVIVFFSFLAVYYTYLLGKCLFSRRVGIIASILMFFYPTFFSHSGMSHLAIPLVALTIISIYYFVKGNKIFYIIFSSLLVLTKESAIFIPLALFLYKVLKDKDINIRKNFIFLIPIFMFLLWLLSNKLHYGYFLWPLSSSLLSLKPIQGVLNGFIVLKSLFFDYYKWILTSFILISCFSFKLLRNRRRIIYSLISSLILFLLMFNMPKFSIYFDQYFPNIINYFLILKNFSILFSLLFFVLLLSFDILIKFWNNKNLYPLYLIFIFEFVFYVLIIPFAPRYSLPIYPIIFIIFSVSLIKVFRKYFYLAFVVMLILFITQWNGDSSNVGFVLEYNMEYVDAVKTHQMATNYLESNFPDEVILASYPQSLELKFPYLGYVKKPMNVVSIPPFPGLTSKNFTVFLNPELYNKTVDLNLIYLVYASDQEFKNRHSRGIDKILNKTLIKRFEMNNKVVEIYKVNKDIDYPFYTLPPD